jgi:adenylate cyclase class 2
MAVEIEAKMKLDNPPAMLERLKAAGAEALGQFFEINRFYDTPDRALLAGDRGLRLRVSRELGSGAERCVLTYKGPNLPGAMKSREEIEMGVSGAEEAERLLNTLGYARCLSFEKRRSSWRLGECRVELDEVPHLGWFIEIEGPSEAAIMEVRERLGLGHQPLIKASYVALLIGYFRERGEAVKEIGFAASSDQRIACTE